MTKPFPRRAQRRQFARRAFTIAEIIVVVVIIGVLAGLIAPRLLSRVSQAKQTSAKSNAKSLAVAMQGFMADHGAPQPDADITILFNRPEGITQAEWEPYVNSTEDLLDPWGRQYILVMPGEKNYDFDIVSYGRDGQPGGEGEDADVVAP